MDARHKYIAARVRGRRRRRPPLAAARRLGTCTHPAAAISHAPRCPQLADSFDVAPDAAEAAVA